MAKLNIGLIGSTITAATATPTTFLMSSDEDVGPDQSSGNLIDTTEEVANEEEDNEKIVRPAWTGSKIPTLAKSSDIKAKYKDVKCLKDSYGDKNTLNNPENSGNPAGGLTYSGNISKGCLVVEHYKQTIGTKGKWWGGLRLVLSVSGSNEGLVIVFNINKNGGKWTSDSSIYILKKDIVNSSIWKLSYAWDNQTRNILNNNEWNKYFPQPGSAMKLTGENANYWGFDPKTERICSGDKCTDGTETKTSMTWNWKKETTQTPITDWSSNHRNWFNELFSGWFQVQNQLLNIKGTWTQQV